MKRLSKKGENMKLNKKLGTLLLLALVGTSLHAAELKSINENNVNSVPLRVISEELGAKTEFDKETQTITITHKDKEIKLKVGSKKATVDSEEVTLQVAAKVVDGTTYVPIRFIGEALGATVKYEKGVLSIALDGQNKEWQLQPTKVSSTNNVSNGTTGVAFKDTSRVVNGKKVTAVTINMNDPKVKVAIATANGKVTQATAIKNMAGNSKVSVNGTYFAAYNGDVPLPDGTIVRNGDVLHITDIGSTIGFTSDNKVLIDFVTTRVNGYVNGEETWMSYRVNRPTSDPSATVIYTSEYGGDIVLPDGFIGVVCLDGKVAKYATSPRTVPQNGFILVMRQDKQNQYPIGASVSYKVDYTPTHTLEEDWENVTYALSAGPSLIINGKETGDPAHEKFTEAKILNQVAQRSFIGVTKGNEVVVGTVSASVSELKKIAKAMGLTSAMCLDGGASSGLYFNGSYLTSPGRNVSNVINFMYS